jgi:hypothetical protein
MGFVAAELLRYAVVTLAVRKQGAPGIGIDLLASGMLAVSVLAAIEGGNMLLSVESSSFYRLGVSASIGGSVWAVCALILIGRDRSWFLDKLSNRS